MLTALAIFILTLTLVIWQPRGLGIGWSASLGALLALLTGLREPRNLSRRSREMLISPAPAPALQADIRLISHPGPALRLLADKQLIVRPRVYLRDLLLAHPRLSMNGSRHILKHPPGSRVLYYSSGRHHNDQILRVLPVELLSHPVPAVRRHKLPPVPERQQRISPLVNLKNNISAAPAIAAGRSALRDILLTMERNTAVAAVAGFNVDLYFIYKHEILLNC